MTTHCPTCHQSISEPIDGPVPLPEIQARLQVGRDKARELIREGVIPGVHHGETYRVPRAAFERFMATGRAESDEREPIPFLHRRTQRFA